MILNIHNLPLSTEEELVMYIKRQTKPIHKLIINPEQLDWLSTDSEGQTGSDKIRRIYNSPFGPIEVEVI